MSRFGPLVGSLLVVALIVGVPLGYASYRKHNLRNLRVVKEGVLLRSGQLSLAGTAPAAGVTDFVKVRVVSSTVAGVTCDYRFSITGT